MTPDLAKLPRDPRGYVIPYIVLRDSDGRPHYTINDTGLRDKCLYQHLCPVCGGKLYRGRWFLGGPGSAFHPHGAYIDTPMHFECMRYSVTTCPYIASVKYTGKIDARTLDPAKTKHTVFLDQTMDDARPKVFVAVMCIGQEILPGPIPSPHVRPKRPYLKIEFWRHGQQLSEAEALGLLDEEQRDYYRVVKRGIAERRIA